MQLQNHLRRLSYLRARNADPMCSFGEYAAISDVVDKHKKDVSDGTVAPGYTPEALESIKAMKGGNFIVFDTIRIMNCLNEKKLS